jgi:tellurite resistance protein TerC
MDISLSTPLFWIGFHVCIALLWVADFDFFGTSPKSSFSKACLLTSGWIALALLFNFFIYLFLGPTEALQFLTGYLIEKSLSIDNLFVFLLIFTSFRLPISVQHRILHWGIIGALFFRVSLILGGIALINRFHWMYYVLGAFLVYSGIKFALETEKKDPSQSFLLRLFKAIFPVAKRQERQKFFIKEKGKWKMTALFLTLLMIESADILFALDSIPAIFAITTDPLIVYTSNVFAILGLRSLYFVLTGVLDKLAYFKFGLAAILIFVGIKMLCAPWMSISVLTSLIVIAAILLATMAFSWFKDRKI